MQYVVKVEKIFNSLVILCYIKPGLSLLCYYYLTPIVLKNVADLLACLWCLTVSLSLSHWYPGSGVVLDCIDS